jgi:hypothetical protein
MCGRSRRICPNDRATIHAYRDRLQGWIANVWTDIGWNAEDWSVNR